MTESAPTLFCSFCMRSQHEVEALLAGPGGIYICGGCVAACNDYIAGRTPAPPAAPELSNERLLAQLPALDSIVRGKGTQLQWAVDQLRAREVSWAEIGQALGVSRQSAWERFS